MYRTFHFPVFYDDGISAKILKELSNIVAPILRIIFQLTLDTGIVPNNWKIANVVPILNAQSHQTNLSKGVATGTTSTT